jgi:integrase
MIHKKLPKLRHHKSSNRGYVYINNQRVYLGFWPSFRLSPPAEINRSYNMFIENLLNKGFPKPISFKESNPKTVSDLCSLFIDSKTSSGDRNNYLIIRKYISGMFPKVKINDFGPHHLVELQKEFLAKNLTRQGINKRINLTRRIFRWGISQNLVMPSTMEFLRSVFPIKKGSAKESKTRNPAKLPDVLKTLNFLHPILQSMVKIQFFTGMRPCEVCRMNLSDLDTSEPKCWWYRPLNHKTSWRGKGRAVPLTEKSIELIKNFLQKAQNNNGYLFSPKNRTKIQKNAKNFYTTSEYGKAVRYAAFKAKVNPWSPNQLRKAAAQKLLEEHGIEAAAALLGHSCSEITRRHYAKQAENKAKMAATSLENILTCDLIGSSNIL